MRNRSTDVSTRQFVRIALGASLAAPCCLAVVLAIGNATLLPLLLVAPILGLVILGSRRRHRQLAARDELAIDATRDTLTAVLKRDAFTALVRRRLARLRRQGRPAGALLVLDADDLRSLNERLGHERGDAALTLIARCIEAMVRSTDIVGRIGGEEFGIFLPGATLEQARGVAERIRTAIAEAVFAGDGDATPLSVSVGGAVFERALPYGELLRLADQQLYRAKSKGRSLVSVAPLIRYEPLPMAA